jgi:hypothetical protein
MNIENKEQILLEKAKEMGIPLRLMTDEEKAHTAHITRNSYFKKKYRMALDITTKMMIQEMYKQNPDWSVKEVLVAAIKEYNSDLPSVLLLEMAQLIVSEWERQQISKNSLVMA